MEQAYKLLTVGEFLDICPKDQRHYELFDGMIVAMAPPEQAHQIIHMNLAFEMGAAMRTHHPGCRLHAEAGIAPSGLEGRDHFEADIAFTCAPTDRDLRGIVSEPLLIVEILSPSTERDDIFVELPAYQSIASLREVLYVESARTLATIYRRSGEGWETSQIDRGDARLQLQTIGLDISPSPALYRGVPGL
jgi:Uma2 family endonuclease